MLTIGQDERKSIKLDSYPRRGFMKFQNPYWSHQTKVELLEKWILVHSIIYYTLGTSIVSDSMFDDNAYQLVDLIKEKPAESKKSKWHYCFKDFDGSTGFDLHSKLRKKDKSALEALAEYLVRQFGKGEKGAKKKVR